MNPRGKTPWEKGESNNKMLGVKRGSHGQGFSSKRRKNEYHAQNPRGY
jgi:hypothetical protein